VEEEIESATARSRRGRELEGVDEHPEIAARGSEDDRGWARDGVPPIVLRRRAFLILGLGLLVALAILVPVLAFGRSVKRSRKVHRFAQLKSAPLEAVLGVGASAGRP
jgi:hypothetical protein